MTFAMRDYQQASVDALIDWWDRHREEDAAPLLVVPTGGGKSLIAAAITKTLFDTWPEYHPRTVVIVPSKELAEQNAEKLKAMLPRTIKVGYYSASIGRRQPDADVIVATIGSVAKHAHVLGNIKCVIVDEAHLINPKDAGLYRQFLNDLGKYCGFRLVGMTATPFRGNGVWLTDSEEALFTGIAYEIRMQTLLDAGHLAPLVLPAEVISTQIDTGAVKLSNTGDYNIRDLSEAVSGYLDGAAEEAVRLAAERNKWIAFCATVANAEQLRDLLRDRGITCEVVTGETKKPIREQLIARFRAGHIRCLVTVLALATGFDVPDVDCILWLRPTRSPVLYCQGAGRGLRIAPGKSDCLWLDFSDTTSRLGPLDQIRGRKRGSGGGLGAPYALCENCGLQVKPASSLICPDCGHTLREEEDKQFEGVSDAAILSGSKPAVVRHPITNVDYAQHFKPGKPDTLRVIYWSGLRIVAKEWVCLSHDGFARAKAERWWTRRQPEGFDFLPGSTEQAIEWLRDGFQLLKPLAIQVNETGKYPEIVGYEFDAAEQPEGSHAGDVAAA
ncbi:DEAD/DEAH box helicase [Pseudomonas nitroreducens]|uniref:DEAD/DEAH box helicase n=1 Tax=Pseudomonas nitroreducens TaxID=46680 RepID=A0A6G6J0K4_PSENT|nr:DEAD/DEAH box helicase [Pseudomonas nitroreducens]QIE88011.1 DEAD/DEAH box helicase [Pseudomonas nitroreducens]